MLLLGVVPVLLHAFVPTAQFIHRGDDAFYYFKLATNFTRYGFWTFDGLLAAGSTGATTLLRDSRIKSSG